MIGREKPDPALVASCLYDLECLWHHGSLGHPAYSDEPLDGLVLTILSQNTNDNNRDRAFKSLKARFPSWEKAAASSWEELADSIRTGGIANVKAKRIIAVLELVHRSFGEYSLKKINEWSDGEIRNYLEKIPGVGPKTAACVLLFDLGRPAFPVDTHVERVT
ncbi:MAG TPA: endonuclease III, partial [Synergistetes bacterium]|nr:endonuclease III [Synergistota bacterium]